MTIQGLTADWKYGSNNIQALIILVNPNKQYFTCRHQFPINGKESVSEGTRPLFPTCEENTHDRDTGIYSLSAAKDRVNNTVPNSTFRNVSQSSQGRAPAACPLILIYCSREAIVSDRKGKPKAPTHHSKHLSRLGFKLCTNYKKSNSNVVNMTDEIRKRMMFYICLITCHFIYFHMSLNI